MSIRKSDVHRGEYNGTCTYLKQEVYEHISLVHKRLVIKADTGASTCISSCIPVVV